MSPMVKLLFCGVLFFSSGTTQLVATEDPFKNQSKAIENHAKLNIYNSYEKPPETQP